MGAGLAIGAACAALAGCVLAARRVQRGPVRVALQVAATLALAELGLRLAFPGDVGQTDSSRSRNAWMVSDHGLASLRRFPIPTALASAPGPRRGEAARVLVVGDSFAAGEGVGRGEDVGSQLAAVLPGADVLNHGLSGLGFSEEADLYEELGRNAQPDAVVWLFVLNDLPSASPSGAIAEAGLEGPFSDGIVDRTLDAGGWGLAVIDVPRVLARRARVADVVAEAYRRGYDPEVSGAELDAFEARLRRLVEDQRSRGGRFLFAVYPILYALDEAPFAAAHAELMRRASAAGAEAIDLAPAFAGAPADAWWASPTDHHPNAAGQASVAERLAVALRAGDLPRVGAPRCEAGAFADDAAGRTSAWTTARVARCVDPADPWAALALARARLTPGGGAPRSRKLALVHVHDALALAAGRADEAEVRAAAEAVVDVAAASSEDR